MAISQLEHYLSYHVRLLLPRVLSIQSSHKVAYAFALVSAVASGFISLISLYAQPWEEHLHYTSWQVNLLATMASLGMYLTPPILGIVADMHGPITLTFISLMGLIPAYLYVGYAFEGGSESTQTYGWTVFSFVIIGIATSASYFSSVITCAKLYPSTKLLSISLPTTCFGLSTLLGSQVLNLSWFWGPNYLDLSKVFKVLSLMYLVVGIMAWVATSIIAMLHHHQQECDNIVQPLLTEEERNAIPPVDIKLFLKDPIIYILALSMLLSLGPLEAFVVNMGTLSRLLFASPAIASQSSLLSIFSFTSTCTRLATGILVDIFLLHRISWKYILITLLCLCFFSQYSILKLTSIPRVMHTSDIWSIGATAGMANGGLFTIYPTIALIIWGKELFGIVYGTMMIAPATGSTISCMLFAHVYDTNCHGSGSSNTCITPVYKWTTLQISISIILTLIILHKWSKRGIQT